MAAVVPASLADLDRLLPNTEVARRFRSYLDEVPAPVPELGMCLRWRPPTDTQGYGQIRDNGSRYNAHVWLWRTLNGPVPDGMELHHFCHEAAWQAGTCAGGKGCEHRRCVVHVEPVTHRDNMLRGNTFQAEQAARDWCTGKHGPHDLRDPRNVYTPPDPNRQHERHCRACNKERVREWRALRAQLHARNSRYGEQLTLIEP